MFDLYDNAIASLQLGIEDFQSDAKNRPISSLRNFYAGVLLLGKACLLYASPDVEDPMEVLATRFTPRTDGNGGVEYTPGHTTIDLDDLKKRFKAFDLEWPVGDISSLQKHRNDFEHFYSAAPKDVIRQTIAKCFPLVEGFFKILERDPATELGNAWEVMLKEESFFLEQKQKCNESLKMLPWIELITDIENIECRRCGSSLVYQIDASNTSPQEIEGKCVACGCEHSASAMIEMLIKCEFGTQSYISAKEGGVGVIHFCPECNDETYVTSGATNLCFNCLHEICGECTRCGIDLDISNQAIDSPSLCSYCDHGLEKTMRD